MPNAPKNLPKRGMMVTILRPTTDCTNNGVTSAKRGYSYAVLLGEGIPELVAPSDDMPALWLENRAAFGPVARPVNVPEGTWTMAGGNFVYSSDSRFRRISDGPIDVHDRIEG
jgi:hypothetical protein